jgi:hypothetical protein
MVDYNSIARAWEDRKFDEYSRKLDRMEEASQLSEDIRECALELKDKIRCAERMGLEVDYGSILDFLEMVGDDIKIYKNF